MTEVNQGELFAFDKRPVIKGFPELRWTGKHPYTSTQYFPAQLKESYGEPISGWMNKLFWGDNLQVMSHLLKEYRGKVDLIYIDPPFDSKADYKKKIKLRGRSVEGDSSAFEEKQYGDIWTSDEYLQFMYERLILLRELLSENGSFYLHCDWHKVHYLKLLLDEVFGVDNYRAEIIWKKTTKTTSFNNFGSEHDTILYYVKNHGTEIFNQAFTDLKKSELYSKYIYLEKPDGSIVKLTSEQKKGLEPLPEGRRFRGVPLLNMNQNRPNLQYEFLGHTRVWAVSKEKMYELLDQGMIFQIDGGLPQKKGFLDTNKGAKVNDMWLDVNPINSQAKEKIDYPTQKPEKLLERIILASTNPGDLVFDCFMGSGTTQAVAMKLGRRFLGADINLGAIQTTTKRLLAASKELNEKLPDGTTYYTGFEVFNVNNYDFFRNPVEAKELIIQALDIQKLDEGNVYDGELDGRMVKILPTNRIATKADLNEFISHLPIKAFEERKAANSTQPVEKITLVCMGHEPDLKASLEGELAEFKIDVEICDILRDKQELQFKHEAEAEVEIIDGELIINSFYPLNLMQKLSMERETVNDWRELVDSILIDWNYDGAVLEPSIQDIPEKNALVKGRYQVPTDAGTIKVKITDLLSESLEVLVEA